MKLPHRAEKLLRRLSQGWRSLDFTLARQLGLASRQDRLFLLLIALTGLLAGGLGIAVHALIDAIQALLWGSGDSLLERAREVPAWLVVAAPTAGGLLVGLIFRLARQRGSGGGMSVLIEAVTLSGGRLPPRPLLVDALAAVATVGAGGSLGREGPMIRLGAMLSSWLGSRFRLSAHRVKILVGCGAAAGLAAVYNIPVGGALFAMEVILGNFALEIFGPIVASSVLSTLIARSVEGNLPHYAAAGYTLVSGWEMIAYAGLGVVGAAAAVAFILGIRGVKWLFGHLGFLPAWLHPALGMGLLGVLALELPHVLGGGTETIQLALGGELPLTLLVVLPLAKLVATGLTRGSGGSGGLFTPSLFFGALVGGAYGALLGQLWPGMVGPPGAYAAVGMAAVTAGTSHAPISAILILFEFTGNYELILPLMLASITASVVARRLYRYSIYTESLERRGVDLSWRMGEAVLAGLRVTDLVRTDKETLSPADSYGTVVERFLATHRQRLFVIGEEGKLLGAVSLHDIKHALEHPETLTAVVAHDLTVPVEQVVGGDERLHRAADLFAKSDFERLPVADDSGRFLGVLAKRDLLAVYAQEVLGRPALLATFVSGEGSRAGREYVELPPEFALRLVPVPPELIGKSLAEASLPQAMGVRVLELKRRGRRGEERVIPGGGTVFEPGDQVIALGPAPALEQLASGRLPVAEAEAVRAID